MSAPQLAVAGVTALKIDLLAPAIGVWQARADLDLPSTQPMPSGAVTVTIGSASLKGTIDPTASGRFGEKAKVRVMGGADGWSKPAKVQHFKSDAGLKSSAVISATAAAVGETVNEPNPLPLSSADFVRMVGDLATEPASRVLRGRVWYVDADGVTQVVDARAMSKPSADVDILAWDPEQRCATLSADTIVWPGTVLTDPRFDTVTIRDVVQTFSTAGSRVQAFCASTEGTRLVTALTTMVEELGQLSRLRSYEYRVTKQNSDGRLFLQAVRKAAGVPDLLPIPVWASSPGDTSKFTPGTGVMVILSDGDGRWPRVFATDGTVPIERHIDATTLIELGAGAPAYAARGDALESIYQALLTFAGTTPLTTVAQIAAAFAALLTALTPPAFTTPRSATIVKVK